MATKYPIVLAHGIILKDIKFFKAFGRIEKILKANGYSVYTSKTDGVGKIESNALQLKRQIEEISHTEIVDFMANKKKKEKIYAFYLELCNDLKKRGY